MGLCSGIALAGNRPLAYWQPLCSNRCSARMLHPLHQILSAGIPSQVLVDCMCLSRDDAEIHKHACATVGLRLQQWPKLDCLIA